jgi:hypothetical protein
MRLSSTNIIRLGVGLWLGVIGPGVWALWAYAGRPAQPAAAPIQWPETSHLERDPQRPTLVMLLHPRCACSRASLSELSRLMARVDGKVTAHVAIQVPAGAGDEWTDTDLWHIARTIQGVRVSADGGDETRAFGAAASGQVLLYDAGGALVFAGGITYARGHEGANDGRQALEARILDGHAPIAQTPVFGCLLRSPS